MQNLFSKIKNYIEKNQLFPISEKVLLAFSAGPDSVFLLKFLTEYLPPENLTLIYFNHGLRNKQEIQKEIDLSQKLTNDLGCSLIIENLKVKEYSKKNKYSLEFAGRELRRKHLLDQAQKLNIATILMAHHLDDICETFFHKLIRGAKSNLSGIAAKSNLAKNIFIIRPLSEITKKEILEYLNLDQIPYCLDHTNSENVYTRNKIRNQLIPIITEINPNYRTQISSYLTYLQEQNNFLNNLIHPLKKKFEKEKNKISLNKKHLENLDPFLQKRLIFQLITEFCGTDCKIASSQITAIYQVLNQSEFKIIELPQKYLCLIDQKNITVLKTETYQTPDYEYLITSLPATIYIKEINQTIEIETEEQGTPLTIRNRRAGDTLKLPNQKITKKLKKYFIDQKIPKLERDLLPLLVKDNLVISIYKI